MLVLSHRSQRTQLQFLAKFHFELSAKGKWKKDGAGGQHLLASSAFQVKPAIKIRGKSHADARGSYHPSPPLQTHIQTEEDCRDLLASITGGKKPKCRCSVAKK